jgi:hypothetical protein
MVVIGVVVAVAAWRLLVCACVRGGDSSSSA